MPSCVFRKCKNYGSKIRKDAGITYHGLPNDELMRHKWICIIRSERCEPDWIPSSCTLMCSAHFKPEDKYTTKKGYIWLKKSAVPFIASDNVPRASTPTSLDDVDISDMESIFDSPVKAILKEKVRKLTIDKQNLQKKNKVLKMQNKRLKDKVISMKKKLNDLSNK